MEAVELNANELDRFGVDEARELLKRVDRRTEKAVILETFWDRIGSIKSGIIEIGDM